MLSVSHNLEFNITKLMGLDCLYIDGIGASTARPNDAFCAGNKLLLNHNILHLADAFQNKCLIIVCVSFIATIEFKFNNFCTTIFWLLCFQGIHIF
jgi:hypothetical protein